MEHLKLSSKSKTLETLAGKIKSASVLPLVRFTLEDYQSKPEEIIQNILARFTEPLIVRSSSLQEDNELTSNAGEFKTVLNVTPEQSALHQAIQEVILSFHDSNGKDEIFIQPMLKEVQIAGVIFTADLDTLAPYYIINYDENGSTSSVTSGSSNDLKTFVCYKEYIEDIKHTNLKMILLGAKECEELFGITSLDIEFAVTKNQLYILQVRQIVHKGKEKLENLDLSNALKKVAKKIEKLNRPHPSLLGARSIFGVMPDWNPAEIIGVKPKNLALSLYKELITDEIWAYQRDNYGYRNLRSHPLLISYLGVPFIDVRVSFNSFIPKSLNESISEKLVNFYLESLKDNIRFHDKVEFEIIFSCYFLGVSKKLSKLKEFGFNENEIKRIEFSLLELTNNIINHENGLYKNDIKKTELLDYRYKQVLSSEISLIDKIYWLTQDCKRYGTLPFAGVARAGFIAVQFLRSFVEEGIMSEAEYNLFLNSLDTISRRLGRDHSTLTKEEFLEIYGHLRPGTYDILSPRYDEDYDNYFKDQKNCHSETGDVKFDFSEDQKLKITSMLAEHGIKGGFTNIMAFIKEAIEGREYTKFIFTRSLSQILKLIEQLGNRYNIPKQDLAHLDFYEITRMYSSLDHRDVKENLIENIQKNKELYRVTKAVKFPSVILDKEEIYSFFLAKDEPNYVTLGKVRAEVFCEEDLKTNNLAGSIVCIQSADPGYDYLFSKKIGGLITCYGGANSHMAIRCAELNIPAVIGCGENLFGTLKEANIIEIDSLNKQVKIIS
jgi:phosphohistidine swiveling domain-containing protein